MISRPPQLPPSGMCASDSRYDVIFREVIRDDSLCDLSKGDLPLMLVNSGGLGYSEGMVSPYGARLSQGDMTDADVSQFTNRTQHDWSGGRGQLDSHGATNRFLDGVADTRFKGRAISAPKRQVFGTPSGTSEVVEVNVTRAGNVLVCANGNKLMWWNGSTQGWEVIGTMPAPITDLAMFAGKLYVAMGTGVAMKRSAADYDLFDFEDTAEKADLLLAYNGYLYTLTKSGVLNYTNGATWNGQIYIDTIANTLTQIVGFRNEVIIIGERGMWSLSANIVYQVASYDQLASDTNGRNAITWVADGRLYLPLRAGLYAWDGAGIQAVGPELEECLPVPQRGVVSAMAGTQRFLYVSVDAARDGGNGISGIYVMGRDGSWHTLALGAAGKSIRAMGIDTLNELPRLWWFENGTPCCMYISDDLADVDKAGFVYENESEVASSWIGSELRWIRKDIDRVLLHADNLSADGRTVEIYLEFDRSGIWRLAGYADESGYSYIPISAPALTAKTWGTVNGQGVVTLASGNTNDMPAGTFIRIGTEIVQVGQIINSTQFKTAHWMPVLPAQGTAIVGSRPVFYEMRYKAVLKTNDENTPIILRGLTARYQDFLLELKRFNLQARAQAGMTDRDGGEYPYAPQELRAKLKEWIYRATPFEMIAPTGEKYLVKAGSLNESGFTRREGGLDSVITLSLWQTQR